MNLVLIFVYLFCGLVLAFPYTWLANGQSKHLMMTVPIAMWATFWMATAWPFGRHKKSITRFLIIVCIFFLPVIMNGLSLLLRALGKIKEADEVFAVRYQSFAVAVFAVIALHFVLVGSGKVQQGVSRRHYY